ncbi:MAG: hypothetical protein ACLFR8_04300 [Alkalispirochaeta sp.]
MKIPVRPVCRRKVLYTALVLFFFTAGFVVPQSVSQVVFLPQTYYVGDRVEARVVVRGVAASDVSVPEDLPDYGWVVIDSVALVERPDGVEVRILFQPFFVGTRELPPLDLEGYLLTGVSAFVTSVAPEEGELQPASVRDQLVLPGTQIQIAAALTVAVGAPLLIFLAGGWGRRFRDHLVRRYRERRPYRVFLRSVRALVGEMHGLDGKSFYIRLLDLFRVYLDARFAAGVRSATTGELDHVLSRAGFAPGLRRSIIDLFQFGDLVKFAHRRVTLNERNGHIEEMRRIVETLQRHGPGGPDVDS